MIFNDFQLFPMILNDFQRLLSSFSIKTGNKIQQTYTC